MTTEPTATTNDTAANTEPRINATHFDGSQDFSVFLNQRALDLLRMVIEEKHAEVINLAEHRHGLDASYPRPTAARETLADGTVIERAQFHAPKEE